MPDFIVGIPTLSRYDLLHTCLESISRGDLLPREICIVDNGGRFRAGASPSGLPDPGDPARPQPGRRRVVEPDPPAIRARRCHLLQRRHRAGPGCPPAPSSNPRPFFASPIGRREFMVLLPPSGSRSGARWETTTKGSGRGTSRTGIIDGGCISPASRPSCSRIIPASSIGIAPPEERPSTASAGTRSGIIASGEVPPRPSCTIGRGTARPMTSWRCTIIMCATIRATSTSTARLSTCWPPSAAT